MGIERITDNAVVLTGEHIEAYRLVTVRLGIKMWRDTRIKLSRNGNIKALLGMTSDVTGKTYKTGKEGYNEAIKDLTTIIDNVGA
jgi:hypothetical protein|tara:strand:- start:8445 stop:8699 length:255 start_codon:yes stop_codon:yes gene_type:complete